MSWTNDDEEYFKMLEKDLNVICPEDKPNIGTMVLCKEKQRRLHLTGLREYFYNNQYNPKHENTFMSCDMFIDHEGKKIYTFYENL
jgi:hypothetical protein